MGAFHKKNKSIGACWLKKKDKEANGRRYTTKYVSFSVNIGRSSAKLNFVAFSSGKKEDKKDNYPDLFIYPSGETTAKYLTMLEEVLIQYGLATRPPEDTPIPVKKADDLSEEEVGEDNEGGINGFY